LSRCDVYTYLVLVFNANDDSYAGYTCDKRWALSKTPKMIVVQEMHMSKGGSCFPNFQKLLHDQSAAYTFTKGPFCRQQNRDLEKSNVFTVKMNIGIGRL
jgi:hypothetical protein